MLGIDEKGLSLKDFIDQNHHLLSSMAVLVAIATFGVTLSINWLGNILLFLSIAGVSTVWIELYKNFPKTGTLRLIVFKNILSLGLLTLGFYWVLAFPAFWNIFSFVPLFAFLFYMLHLNTKQFMSIHFIGNIFGKDGERNIYQRILVWCYSCVILITLIWMLGMSMSAAPGLNMLLELIRVNFK